MVGGREVQQGRDIFIPVAYSCYVWQKIIDYYKAVIPQLKIKESPVLDLFDKNKKYL